MKKIASILLSLICLFSFASCGKDTNNKTAGNSSVNTVRDSLDGNTNANGDTDKRTLIVYFSATKNTKTVAGYIAGALNADTFELVPSDPYTNADLNWNDDNSRVCKEHNSPEKRNVALKNAVPDNFENYDTVFIGYPIWWGEAAWTVNSFLTSNDFSGKTVIPFCTSASSGLSNGGEKLEKIAGTEGWLQGKRFSSNAPESEVNKWEMSFNKKQKV